MTNVREEQRSRASGVVIFWVFSGLFVGYYWVVSGLFVGYYWVVFGLFVGCLTQLW